MDDVAAADDRPDLTGPRAAAEFERLYDRYAPALHRYLVRRVGPPADDLVSETFLVALRTSASYDPGRGAARSWLYGIATNLARRHVRDEVRALDVAARAASADERADGHDAAVATRVDAEARVRQLAARLARLDAGDRDVLLLTSWAGLDSTEVAAALGIPVGTVRSRLHRVRRRLRGGGTDMDTNTGTDTDEEIR